MKLSENGGGGLAGRSTRVESILKIMQLSKFTAIDLGSNEGYNCFDLHEAGCREVVGIEIRDRYLARAELQRIKLNCQHVRFLQRDVRKIDEIGLGKFELCLCTGLLYHMQNPFNLLKRIRNICNILVLETHISPSAFRYFMAEKKYRCNLTFSNHKVWLDNEVFEGRLNIFPASTNMDDTSASVVSNTTFWPDKKSLLKALELAGFRLRVIYFSKTPKGFPRISVHHGYRRTKVFLVADVIDTNTHVPVEEGSIAGCQLLAADND